MNPQNNQSPANNLSDDDLAAALGFVTTIGEQHYSKLYPGDVSQDQETSKEDKTEPAENIDSKLEALKKEIESTVEKKIKDEIGQMKDLITSALNEESAHESN